jgi:hypothetical protein
MLRLVGQTGFAWVMLLSTLTARADSWVAQYMKARPELEQVCAHHELAACRQGLLKLETLLDGRQDIIYKLARVEAELGLTDSALRRLDIYAHSGLDRGDPGTDSAFADLKKRGLLDHILQAYQAGQAAQTAHERIATLGDSDLVAEDMVCNRANGSFLISSVRKRKILRLSAMSEIKDFITQTNPPLWGVFALGLDLPRHTLWATTATIPVSPPYTAEDADRSAVLAFDASSGKLVGRYPGSRGGKHSFGDLTVAPGGEVYVSDGVGGGVYTIASAGGSQLTSLVEPGALGSPQTPALSADGSHLFVPDYMRGIAIVDPTTHAVRWLEHPPELALFGIDGLYLEGHTLVAIQNGTAPKRIITLQLNTTLDGVVSWRVLLARAPGLGDPTHGCLYHGEFSFIANSGWDQFRDDGERDPKVAPQPPEIWKIRVPTGAQ